MDKLLKIVRKKCRTVVGMMSGTSVDGLDLAAARICGCGRQTKVEILKTEKIDYPSPLRKKILNSMREDAKVREACPLDFEVGTFFGKCVKKFVSSNELRVDVIASHGQTIYHHPHSDSSFACTLQIGDGDLIATESGIVTISDFRIKDMAYGGEGAPLVPYVDYLLYSSEGESIALNNLGGISNVTYIPKGAREDEITAFDTGPANALIDVAVSNFFGIAFDEDGKFSSKGHINEKAFEALKKREMPYISRTPPKSTGKEVYNEHYIAEFMNLDPYDVLRTLVEFTAWTIWESYRRYIIPNGLDRIVLTGGGVMNQTLVKALRRYFKGIPVDIAGDWKFREAKAFAVLANELLCSNRANIPHITGAFSKAFLGKISLP